MKKTEQSVLQAAAKKARVNAYAPYSHHHVGAAVMTQSGKIYSSGNVENGCYALTICAERGALYHAIANGDYEFQALAVTNGSAELITPCGVCRQVLWELAGDIEIILFNSKRKKVVTTLSKLYPKPYKKKSEKRLVKHRKK